MQLDFELYLYYLVAWILSSQVFDHSKKRLSRWSRSSLCVLRAIPHWEQGTAVCFHLRSVYVVHAYQQSTTTKVGKNRGPSCRNGGKILYILSSFSTLCWAEGVPSGAAQQRDSTLYFVLAGVTLVEFDWSTEPHITYVPPSHY